MQIISYEYHHDLNGDKWSIGETKFGGFNLLVGDTGTGKTKFLNTIFNLGANVANKTAPTKPGCWRITFTADKHIYKWHLEINMDNDTGDTLIINDHLIQIDGDKETPIIERTQDEFIFNGIKMPKLPRNAPSIKILCEEDSIKPLYKEFGKIKRRRFSQDGLDDVCTLQALPQNLIKAPKKNISLEKIFFMELGLNATLFLLSKHYSNLYNIIRDYYKAIFPFIIDTAVLDFNTLHKGISITGKVPVFCMKEKGDDKWIQLSEFSSGMQKVLLILTDLYTLPHDSIYLIDEYENSLGVNAINFFPDIVYSIDTKTQLFVTSHHPYIINNVPVKNWYVFHRKGKVVKIRYGDELVEKYGKSKQDAFINLINDSFFKDGIE